MGLWAGIKYALNSTVGTATFKPLDRLVDDAMHKYTLGSKQYIASDTKIIQYVTADTTIRNSATLTLGHFTPAIGGYVRFNYKIYSGNEKGNTVITLNDETDDVIVYSDNIRFGIPGNNEQKFADVKIKADHLYKITASHSNTSTSSTGWVGNVFISGDVSEAPLYDYTIGG